MIAPMMFDSAFVLKNFRKLGDWMTIVITPESYPKRKLPLAANTARQTLKRRPISADDLQKQRARDLGTTKAREAPEVLNKANTARSHAVVPH